MNPCQTCGASLAAAATWCGQCYAAVPAAAGAGVPGLPGRAWTPPGASALPPPPARRTRWGKTATTFGPAGRLAATLAVLCPLAVMVFGGLADPLVWGGAFVWVVVIVPWAMRDIWKAGQVPVR